MIRRSRGPGLARRVLVLVAVACAASVAHAQQAGESSGASRLGGLARGWNRIDGGPTTICSLGSPYTFFVEPGDSSRLMVYFEGGGACWSAETCNVKARTHYYKPVLPRDERPYATGLFDASRADNPARDFTKVFVPYCTGDVHLGARTTRYTLPASNGSAERTFEIHHNGGANADAVLRWIYSHLAAPRTIFVTGESAGSVPTPFYAAVLARHYAGARVIQLGDASNAYQDAGAGVTNWGLLPRLRAEQAFRSLDSTNFNLLTLFDLAARSSPHIAFAVVNSAEDSVQAGYLRALDRNAPSVNSLLARHDRELSASIPGFRSYTYPGAQHTIIERPEFYTMTVDGIRLRDWVAGLIDGSPLPNVGQALLGDR